MGTKVYVIPVDDLLSYKKLLRRHVDLADIEDVESLMKT